LPERPAGQPSIEQLEREFGRSLEHPQGTR
jgi:hypothetical protein